jgi:hypothetical protein
MTKWESIKEFFTGRCRFISRCRYYRVDSDTCTQHAGIYYAGGGVAGCYRENLRIEAPKIHHIKIVEAAR